MKASRTKALYQCGVSDKFRELNTFGSGLYALIDDGIRPEISMRNKALAMIQAGVPVVQLRMENTSKREGLRVCAEVVQLARGSDTKIIVNDCVDIALASGAHGVHLGLDDLPIEIARKLLPDKIIGATCRNLAQIEAAARAGANYAGVGPVFSTQTKVLTASPIGLDSVLALARNAQIPVVAIGGLKLEHAVFFAKSIVYSMAVASDLFCEDDMVSRARAYLRAFSITRT
jgi:thiamine-phosphate pyrophosphorylase